jgi:hypothetical protein
MEERMKTRFVLSLVLLFVPLSYAGQIHDDCYSKKSSHRFFAAGFIGGVASGLMDERDAAGRPVYRVPDKFSEVYIQVCDELDRHPDLWGLPSRIAIRSVADILWKNPTYKHFDPFGDTNAWVIDKKLP